MKPRIIILALCLSAVSCLGAAPEWFISGRYRSVVRETHLIGVGMGDSFESASNTALADLIKHIETSVKTVSESYLASFIEDDREFIEENYQANITSMSQATLRGAETIVKAEADGKFFVMKAVSKDTWLQGLSGTLDVNRQAVHKIRAESDSLLTRGEVFKALEQLIATEALYSELSSGAALYAAIAGSNYSTGEILSGPAILSEVRSVLGNIQLRKVSGDGQSVRRGDMMPMPLGIKVIYAGSGTEIPMSGIRLSLKDEDGEIIEKRASDENGQVEFRPYAQGLLNGKATVNVDLARIPEVFRRDVKKLEVVFDYKVQEPEPRIFTVKIVDQAGSRLGEVEENIARTVVNAGHKVSGDAALLLFGAVEEESRELAGMSGKQYMVKVTLNLEIKVKATSQSVTAWSVSANGVDDKSVQNAKKKALQQLKITTKNFAKTVAYAGSKLDVKQ